ncbi:MAG TPA: Hsp20/alpha crystallin family protein [Fredinandcohnia sp.]|nr:Hsp20/alpha crystallin family protein [Fredinandcohnia sp.]
MQPPNNGSLAVDPTVGDLARFYRPLAGHPFANTPLHPSQLASGLLRTVPAVDCWELEGELLIVFDLPGIERSSLDVRIEGGALRLSAQREKGPEAARPAALERPVGRLERTIVLPKNITAEPLGAELVNGTLRVRLSRREGPMVSCPIHVN